MWQGDRAYEETALVLHGYVYARTIRICCKAATASEVVTESRVICTDHLAWVKAGPSPGRCVCGAAIETPPANPVIQLRGSVVRVYGVEMLLSRVVISDLMCSTRYLRWDYMCGRGICCSAGSSFVGRIAGFSPWLNTIRGLGEASRLLVICTRTLRFGTWIVDIGIIRGSDIYVYILNQTSSGWGR